VEFHKQEQTGAFIKIEDYRTAERYVGYSKRRHRKCASAGYFQWAGSLRCVISLRDSTKQLGGGTSGSRKKKSITLNRKRATMELRKSE